MKEEKKLSSLALASIIVIVVVILLMAISLAISGASKAREDAFRIEATKVVVAADTAKEEYSKGNITIDNDNESCITNNAFCITVKKLVDLKLYDQDSKYFKGKVNIFTKDENTEYRLYLKKNDEFKIIGGIWKDYSKYGLITKNPWENSFEICECE